MPKPTIVTPAEFLADNPNKIVDADKALKQINDNLKVGQRVTVFPGKNQINHLGTDTAAKLLIVEAEFSAAGWTVSTVSNAQGITVTLSAAGVE